MNLASFIFLRHPSCIVLKALGSYREVAHSWHWDPYSKQKQNTKNYDFCDSTIHPWHLCSNSIFLFYSFLAYRAIDFRTALLYILCLGTSRPLPFHYFPSKPLWPQELYLYSYIMCVLPCLKNYFTHMCEHTHTPLKNPFLFPGLYRCLFQLKTPKSKNSKLRPTYERTNCICLSEPRPGLPNSREFCSSTHCPADFIFF